MRLPANSKRTFPVALSRRLVQTMICSLTISHAVAGSTCFGTTSNGRLENSVQLPKAGQNFAPYSELGVSLGRTYAHSEVAAIVAEAWTSLEKTAPKVTFVYGESGWEKGGSFKPHRTHQNGLSVDFFVPVRNASGASVPLPTSVGNKFGYNIDFDAKGKFGEFEIDFEAIGEHLFQLHQAALRRQARLKLVIFDPPYLPRLFATKRGEFLQKNVAFMKHAAWVRHDEHYHVDFDIQCKSR